MTGTPGDVFQQIRDICQPLRSGVRFGDLPAAQVWVAGGKVNRLGPLLPEADEEEAEYCARLADAGHQRFALRIVEPWARSPEWWAWMRDLIRPIWQERGQPVIPTDTELVYSHGLIPPARQADDQEAYTWLLAGATQPAWPAGGAWHTGPGEEPYVVGAPVAVWQRLLLGTDSRRAVAVAAETISNELATDSEGSPTPYTPWKRYGAEVPALREVSARIADAIEDEGHERRLMAQWLRRSSAGGLEPVPPPRNGLETIPPEMQFRRRATVLHGQVESELLCAANGHLFAVADTALADLIVRINGCATVAVSDLTEEWPEAVVHAVLTRLYRMHALEVAA